MRTTCSRSYTKIFPSPILPVRAEPSTASITRSTRSSDTAASIFTLGRKSTTYSAPRYSSVWPFWRPKPLTSVTVMPCTPIPERASRTSSSLNALMIAVTSFMMAPLETAGSEAVLRADHQAGPAGELAGGGEVERSLGVGADHRGGQRESAAHVLADRERVIGVRGHARVPDLLVSDVRHERPA